MLFMGGLIAAYLFSALLATATPIGRVNSLIVGDVHEREIANLIPRAPPSDHAGQRKLSNEFLEHRLSDIISQSAIGEKNDVVTPKVTKWITDLVPNIPEIGRGDDEDAARIRKLLLKCFFMAREQVAAWKSSDNKKSADSGINRWKEALFPHHPKRVSTETEFSYITKQLRYIESNLNVREEKKQRLLGLYLTILSQDIERLMSMDVEALFHGMKALSLDMSKGSLDVGKMFPTIQRLPLRSQDRVEELAAMLVLAFKVLWKAKGKVAGWTPSEAKHNSRSALMAWEEALEKVGNEERVSPNRLRRLLNTVNESHPGFTHDVQAFLLALTKAKITDQMEMQHELDTAYETRKKKVGFQYHEDLNDIPLKEWEELNTLGRDEPYTL